MKDIEQPIKFNYSLCCDQFIDKCPSVKTLKVFLDQFDDNLPVIFTWEGVSRGVDYIRIDDENIQIDGKAIKTKALIISVE
jgi:hypothetical protein